MPNINENYNALTKLKNWWQIVKSNFSILSEAIDDHVGDKDNPHEVTAEQVGLGNVDNTSDQDKPVSTAVSEALDEKADKASATGGFEGGTGANSLAGGVAIGKNTAAVDGGAAIGQNASSTNGGGAIGSGARANAGGAAGVSAQVSSYGGAVGRNACAGAGFSGGNNAKAAAQEGFTSVFIDAIQLGEGTNSEPKTLQVYGHRLMDADGKIPASALDGMLVQDLGEKEYFDWDDVFDELMEAGIYRYHTNGPAGAPGGYIIVVEEDGSDSEPLQLDIVESSIIRFRTRNVVESGTSMVYGDWNEWDTFVKSSDKNAANGYAGLDSGGKIPASVLDGLLVKDLGTKRYEEWWDDGTLDAITDSGIYLYRTQGPANAQGGILFVVSANDSSEAPTLQLRVSEDGGILSYRQKPYEGTNPGAQWSAWESFVKSSDLEAAQASLSETAAAANLLLGVEES